jgi:hypothetical protein
MYGNLIAATTVGSGGAASVTFSGIPQTFTDLILVYSGRSSTDDLFDWGIQVNGDGSTNKLDRNVIYNSSSGSAQSLSNTLTAAGNAGRVPITSGTSNTFGNVKIYIPNYATSVSKVYSFDNVAENNATTIGSGVFVTFGGGSFGITSAITSVSVRWIVAGSLAMNQNTTVYLYGLTKGSGGATVS